METTVLRLHLGYPTPYSLGLATTTPSQPAPEVLDLLATGLTVRESGGASDWIPTIAGTKSGQWADSETANGRMPISLPTANAIESMSVVASSVQAGTALLSKLNRFAEIGRAFWTETAQRPLYLEWAASSGAGSQWALIYNMQAAIEQFDPLDAGEPLVVSLSIERESAWRAIAPGLPAKYWTLIKRGLLPTVENPAPAGFFNFDDLDLNSGAGDKAPLYTLSTRFGDELDTSNINFIDVAAADIPGDAPTLVSLVKTTGVTTPAPGLFFAKDASIDYGTLNAFGVAGTYAPGTRRRMRFNSGDWATNTPVNVTVTKQIDANAWLGNGSIVNRTCIRLVFAAAASSNGTVATFNMPIQAYLGGRYGVFLTYNATAANVVTANAQVVTFGQLVQQLDTVSLTNTASQGESIYLGEVSFTQTRPVDFRGYPTADNAFTLNVRVSKAGATTPTVNLFDVWLLPLNEGNITIANGNALYDNTGYASLIDDFAGNQLGNNIYPAASNGTGFTLTPGVTNRIYASAIIGYVGGAPTEVFLNLIPRWYGVRTV